MREFRKHMLLTMLLLAAGLPGCKANTRVLTISVVLLAVMAAVPTFVAVTPVTKKLFSRFSTGRAKQAFGDQCLPTIGPHSTDGEALDLIKRHIFDETRWDNACGDWAPSDGDHH